MRTSMKFLAVTALATASLGCGSDETTSTTEAQTTTTMSIAALHDMLLTVDDLGTGWVTGEPINAADLTDSVQVPCPDQGINPTIAARLRAQSAVQFDGAGASYSHLIEFIVSGEPTQLAADLDVWFEGFDACMTSTTSAGSDPTLLSIEQLALPTLGDQRGGYVLDGRESSSDTVVWHGHTAIVRVGGVAITVGLIEILDSASAQPTIDDAAFVTMVEAAVANLTPS